MDEDHFSDFYSAQFADVWRFARRRTETGHDADDVTAETFAVAWRRRADIPADGARLWLFGVARNVLANHDRDSRRRGRLHLKILTRGTPQETYETADNPGSDLWRALAALSPDDRELLLLRAWDRLAVTEIATLLGISAATASSRLHKARRRLDRELDPDTTRPREDEHA
ncbi:DNA-directed RNA polymerase sigma-70 factor [Actinoplanes sp. NBRC 14428]|uniref:RNA polymerase sigma-70 factor (ECF subfamily) n=1 Tax=Pseudosporangium ferrugineum TaxID=439699 RepID=A0A2T0RF78_9ACTN|nr:RNA polymerase sigma factor [Pseudosporangium ferrugineum]PRY19750.1 RNA polymerase sigma-70 factor (ECF subfamily) [Pseudosporangium ferrugineum]BCJ51969.1 DNA-directed RNA polymerase sigma-70 factor [Actinoplanes sp. NBRC 14428]